MSGIFDFIGEWTSSRGGSEEGLDEAVWARFGCERTVLIVDMEGFTVSTRERGIVHYLRLIRRMQNLALPILDRHAGSLIRFEADNLFAVFPDPSRALAMMVEMIGALDRDNGSRAEGDRVQVSAGIDHGQILLDEGDFFGDAVNLASKLGEDLARANQVLVTSTVREMSMEAGGVEFVEFGQHSYPGTPEQVYQLVLAR